MFDENRLEKLNVYLFWERFLLNIEPSEIDKLNAYLFVGNVVAK